MVTVTLHRKYPCLEPDVPLRHAEVLLLVRMATGRLPPGVASLPCQYAHPTIFI
jgi:hypothetical protein